MGNSGDLTGFWLIALVLAGGIAVLLIASLVLARRHQREPELAQDIRLYREQLAGIERDAARGILSAEDAGRLRTEIGRRLLESDRRNPGGSGTGSGAQGNGGTGLWLPAGIIFAALAAGVAVYLKLGSPGVPDQPIGLRIALADQRISNRPSQAEYVAMLPPVEPMQPEADMVEPLQKLRETVDPARSDSLQGLELLSRIEARLGNFPDAILAQTRLISLRGDAASASNYGDLVLMLVDQAQGYVSPEAETAVITGLGLASRADLDRIADLLLAAAQGFSPQGPEREVLNNLPPVSAETGPLFLFGGEIYAQGGRPDRAFALWRPLIEAGPQDAFWVPRLRDQIRAAAWYAGAWDYQLPAGPEGATRGPDASAIAGAAGMEGAEVRDMAEGMVTGLSTRLLAEGGSGAEWAQLIRALTVLGRDDEAREMLALAVKAHPEGEARATIDAAGQAIGQTERLP